MNSQYPSSSSSGVASGTTQSDNQTKGSSAAQDMRAKASEAAAKITDVAQQAGSQAKETAASLASDASRKVKSLLNMQVTAGAELAGHIADSARCAADNLDQNAPQLAGLVRGAAEQLEEFSRDMRYQTVEALMRTASDFTRRQPALVFGLASLAGVLAFRVLKSSPPNRSQQGDRSGEAFDARAGHFHGT